MEVKRMRFLCVEIYKALHDLYGPDYIGRYFQVQQPAYSSRRPHDIPVPRVSSTKFGTRSEEYEAARIWNHLPNSVKSAENLQIFKTLIKTCKVCQFFVSTFQRFSAKEHRFP